ncbi:MAG: NusG domain II-containing protein [Ezakiella sp.]|nr:NusG domain II-containing protein [Ezakiella sp.]MDD7471391.1 NusG domain II-containing protein [Bacillota bacterium]MDY3922888.1 NusG domain II-containing protein [Ezakiella sp.]
MTKYDLAILIVIIFIAAAVLVFIPSKTATGIEVKVDGKVIYTSDFKKSPTTKKFETKYGMNEIEIGEDYVRMIDADCPNKLAVKQGKIKSPGASLICIPHHMIVSIVGKSDELDVMVK